MVVQIGCGAGGMRRKWVLGYIARLRLFERVGPQVFEY